MNKLEEELFIIKCETTKMGVDQYSTGSLRLLRTLGL